MSDFLTKLFSTLLTVVIAVLVSGGLWIGANLLFNQLRTNFVRYRALVWGLLGFVGGVLLSGNRLTVASTSEGGTIARLVAWGWLPLLLALATSAIGTVLATVSSPRTRLAVGAGGLGVTGLVAGLLIVDSAQPTVSIASLVVSTAVGTGIGATVHRLSSRTSPGAIFLGAALGWMIGAWAIPELGSGTTVWSGIALLVPSALLGTRSALLPIPDQTERNQLDQRSRSAIFLGPALLFIFAALVVPTIRTLYLSLLDRKSESFVGIDNYISIFKDPKALNLTEWQAIFGSRLFWAALICFIAFIILAVRARRQTGHLVELGSASSGPLITGIVLLGFAVFTALRGTLINNLWWVLAVTLLSTSFGLAIAVLADGVRLERVAKAIIFMPMAVSLVGASVVWRFMYIARDSSKSQTGVINALWVGLGRLSTGSGLPTLIFGLVVLAILGALLVFAAKSLASGNNGRAVAPLVAVGLLGWFSWRYWGITGDGVGGFRFNGSGQQVAAPIYFVQEPPFNNFWLMVVLIWIQTGFAMVILSAAIKAVPTELLEAARVDGASTSQIFWKVTLPQISTTIGVVVTTLIVLVMKVFDIVKVMTNGTLGTEVLANNMYREAFSNFNTGVGAALAGLIFFSVLPVMFINIRRMQREG